MKGTLITTRHGIFQCMTTLLLMFSFLMRGSAQNAVADFNNMSKAMKDARIGFEMNYNLFSQHSGGVLIQSRHAEYFLWERMIYYRMDDIELLNNKQFSLSIANKRKTIVLNKASDDYRDKLIKYVKALTPDSIITRMAETELLEQNDSGRVWRIKYRQPYKGIAFLDVGISLPSFRIRKMTMYYQRSFADIYGTSPRNIAKTDKPRLEVAYVGYRQLEAGERDKYFSGNGIVSIDKKGKVTLGDKYKDYHLANYYNLKK